MMVKWKLFVENYGKIESAEIECAPLTLIVGDNNCGKSYLMSLLWGIKNYGATRLFDNRDIWEEECAKSLLRWLDDIILNTGDGQETDTKIGGRSIELEQLINDFLNCNKDVLLSWMFNSNTVHADQIKITLNKDECSNYMIHCRKSAQHVMLELRREIGGCADQSYGVSKWSEQSKESNERFILQAIFSNLLNCELTGSRNRHTYLPAARTGFMLAKDVVNKVGREQTFNYNHEETNLIPFTRPINQFLDIINDLPNELQGNIRYEALARYIESNLIDGDVDISNTANKEIFYRPAGQEKDIPLRTVSAVVTELTPLVLLLKHSQNVEDLYYEEPEMCLHPQLQNMMSTVLIRMVHTGINVVATTHSDILLQAINNRIKLSNHPRKEEICTELGFEPEDFITGESVSVYQFDKKGNKSKLVKLECGENGFVVPSFNNALDMIMEEAYKIQG